MLSLFRQNKTFIAALKDHPEVLSVTASGDIPGKEVGNSWNLRWTKMPETALKRCRTFRIDDQFMNDFGLQLVAGRMFSNDFGTEENNAILNETAVKVLGFANPEDALGQEIVPTDPGNFKVTVVGVIKDYHQESLRFDYKPIVYFFGNNDWEYFSAKIRTSDMPGLLAFAERTWKTHFADTPFNHFFLDDFFNRQYVADLQFGWVIGLFTLLAILVACLGLFGLTVFNVARREKEIGIRKVLGANVAQILTLISSDFIQILLISSIIALPVAWFFAKKWLTGYAYSIHLNIWFFLIPLVLILAFAALTVGVQSLKAALANPADSLRNE
ncbi:MAG TPA: FtsX-like permease family protein [Flavilitoribacter sp.]|nr:FtsX-like permease family protein [Flavilitoribacter sp.]HMQ86034.1 FtsX-like permease family protein [Flavilitoribacter sp.]